MRARLKKILGLGLAGLLVFMVLALAGLLLAASSDRVRDWALASAGRQLRARTGIRLETASVSGSLLHHLTLAGVRLVQGGRVLFSARKVEIVHNPLALLGGRLKISRLRLADPRVSLPWRLPSGSDGPPPLALTIKGVSITGGALDPGGAWGPLAELTGLDVSGSLNLDLGGLRAQIRLSAGRARLADATHDLSLTGAARLHGSVLEVEQIALAAGRSRLAAAGRLDWSRELRFRARVRGALSDYAALPYAWPGPRPPSGPLAVDISLRGSPADCALRARLSQGRGGLSIGGPLDLTDPLARLDLAFSRLDLERWGLAPLSVVLQGRGKLKARGLGGPGMRADLDLNLDRLAVRGVEAGRTLLRAGWASGKARVKSLEVRAPWGALKGRAELAAPRGGRPSVLTADLEFNNLRIPGELAGDLPEGLRRALLNGRAQARGPLDNLDLSLNLASSGDAPGPRLEAFSARGKLDNRGWRLERVQARGPWGRLEAKGGLNAQGADMNFTLASPRLEALAAALEAAGASAPRGLTGALEMSGRLGSAWSAPSLDLDAKGTDLAGGGLAAQGFYLKLRAARIRPRPRGRLDLTVRGLSIGDEFLDSLKLGAALGDAGLNLHLAGRGPRGRLTLALSGRAPWDRSQPLYLDALKFQPPQGPAWRLRGRARLDLGPDAGGVRGLDLAAGRQRIAASGSWRAAGEVAADIRIDKVLLAPWLAGKGPPPGARLDARLRLGGSLASPEFSLEGAVRGLKWSKLPPVEVRLGGGYDGRALKLKGQASCGGREVLGLRASLGLGLSLAPLGLKPDGRLQASLWADDFPLDILRPLLKGVSGLKGDARLRLTASGALDHPVLDGFLDLKRGRFTVNATAQSFQNLEARLELHDSRLTVKKLSLTSGGSLKLTGWLDMPWRSGGKVNLKLKAADFRVSLGLSGQAALAADISAAGDIQAPLISGRVTPTQLELSLTSQAPPEMRDVVVLRPGQKPPPMVQGAPSMVWRPQGLLGRSRIDLRVQAPPDFKIKMGLGWMMASGGARLLKQPGEALTYHDRLTFPNGVIIVEGKRFQLQRGSLDFAGRDRPDPNLAAKVYHKAGKTMVWISLAGLASDPQISFSSEPPMGKADILAAVFFGKTASELDQGQSQSMAALALALLGQKGVQELSRVLGPALAPDVVTVHDGDGGSALEAGKYISPDLYLRYRQQIGEEDNGQSLGVEYRINRYFSLDSQLGSDRDTGLDLIVDFDFD